MKTYSLVPKRDNHKSCEQAKDDVFLYLRKSGGIIIKGDDTIHSLLRHAHTFYRIPYSAHRLSYLIAFKGVSSDFGFPLSKSGRISIE